MKEKQNVFDRFSYVICRYNVMCDLCKGFV